MPVSLKAAAKKYLGKATNLILSQSKLQEKNSPQVKINQRMLFNFYRYSLSQGYRMPDVSIESILGHPRNQERQKLFDPIRDWKYIHV